MQGSDTSRETASVVCVALNCETLLPLDSSLQIHFKIYLIACSEQPLTVLKRLLGLSLVLQRMEFVVIRRSLHQARSIDHVKQGHIYSLSTLESMLEIILI
jgi:hypothetical protein